MSGNSLFAQDASETPLVGIAKLAARGEALAEGHKVDYISIENRSLLTRCNSTRMPFTWMINPYRGCEFACKYCYARYTHEFMEMRDGLEFERKIYVKQHSAWLLRQELKQVRAGQSIAIGTATDPYQPAEKKFGVTRAILEEFARRRGLSLGLVTKSDLIVRDIDLLRAISLRNRLGIHLTVTTTRTDLARILEPRAPRPDLRLETVSKLNLLGIRTGISCAPVVPGITDSPRNLEAVIKAGKEAGASYLFANPLNLRPGSAAVFLPFIEEKFPALAAQYRERYGKRTYVEKAYQQRISSLVRALKRKHGLVSRHREVRHQEEEPPIIAAARDQLRLF